MARVSGARTRPRFVSTKGGVGEWGPYSVVVGVGGGAKGGWGGGRTV